MVRWSWENTWTKPSENDERGRKSSGPFLENLLLLLHVFFWAVIRHTLAAGWLAEMELDDPIHLTNILTVLDTRVHYLQAGESCPCAIPKCI